MLLKFRAVDRSITTWDIAILVLGNIPVISLHQGIKFIPLDYQEYRYTNILLITFFCGLEVSMKL